MSRLVLEVSMLLMISLSLASKLMVCSNVLSESTQLMTFTFVFSVRKEVRIVICAFSLISDVLEALPCEKVEGEGCEMALSANGEFEFTDIQSGVYTLV